MRLAKDNRPDRRAAGGERLGPARARLARCRTWRRAGTGAAARIICGGTGRWQQRGRFRGGAGMSGGPGRSTAVLVARGNGGAAWPSSCAGAGRDRDRSGAAGAGRSARSDDAVARGSRCGALWPRRHGGDRIVAKPSRLRSDGKPTTGIGGGGVGRHHAAPADRGQARPQRRADALERRCRPLPRVGGQCPRLALLRPRIAAPARPPCRRALASGVGS